MEKIPELFYSLIIQELLDEQPLSLKAKFKYTQLHGFVVIE